MAHAYNPSYLGGEGLRISSSRPALATLERPCLKNKMQSKELEVWLKC
jgi:hypothetical protein